MKYSFTLFIRKSLPVIFIVLGFQIKAQVNANFSANLTSGCSPILVQFQDQSTGNIVAWNWNLGISTSNVQNPAAFYNTGGNHIFCITILIYIIIDDTINMILSQALPVTL